MESTYCFCSLPQFIIIFFHLLFCRKDCAKAIVWIITKFSHNVPLMNEKILLSFRNDHATQRPLVAVFQKVSKNNMCSPRVNLWAAHNKEQFLETRNGWQPYSPPRGSAIVKWKSLTLIHNLLSAGDPCQVPSLLGVSTKLLKM